MTRARCFAATGLAAATLGSLFAAIAPVGADDAGTGGSFSCTLAHSWSDCGFTAQAKEPDRITTTEAAGIPAVRLETQPGDQGINGSGHNERTDLTLSPEATACAQGAEQWWTHSLLFPDDYVPPLVTRDDRYPWGVVFDFHHSRIGGGQANFEIEVVGSPPGLRLAISGGPVVSNGAPGSPTRFWPIGPLTKNHWYRFVYHVRWSSADDGFFDAWMDGKSVLTYRGPTLYAGQTCYLKLANYHTPVGKPVAVLHALVRGGATESALGLQAPPH